MNKQRSRLYRFYDFFIGGLLVLVLSWISYAGQSQENAIREPQQILIDITKFYRADYIKFLDELDWVELVRELKFPENITETQRVFFKAGFIRALLEHNTFEAYNKNLGNVFIDNFHRGSNAAYEMLGWKEGCRVARKRGEIIVLKYAEYLKGLSQ